jgi:hypothetical protein
MADPVNESELGRSNKSTTFRDHLFHLLNIGWAPDSPLIQKFVRENGLTRDLNEWTAEHIGVKPQKATAGRK